MRSQSSLNCADRRGVLAFWREFWMAGRRYPCSANFVVLMKHLSQCEARCEALPMVAFTSNC